MGGEFLRRQAQKGDQMASPAFERFRFAFFEDPNSARDYLDTQTIEALDGDAILAAQAVTAAQPGDRVIVATTNVGHLNRFPGVEAKPWDYITAPPP